MSFTPEIFRSKLDSLQDTQDSIVSISQWVLFHHRHAAQLCLLWADYALDNTTAFSPKKKLSLLYLANDVVQQARHKRKPEFISGFAVVLPKVFHSIYGTVGSEIQPKMERLISVWSQRNVFSSGQIAAMENAISLLKSGKGLGDLSLQESAKVPLTVAPAVAPALAPLNALFQSISKATESSTANVSLIKNQATMYLPEDPSTQENLPLPKVYISKLNMLEKLCTMTTSTLTEAEQVQALALLILAELEKDLKDSMAAGKEKLAYIQSQLPRLNSVREELKEILDEEASPLFESEPPSPTIDAPPAEIPSGPAKKSADFVPKYASSSDDSDEEQEIPRKRSLPEDARPSKKTVAFSEDIQIKEFERDDHEENGENEGYENGHSAEEAEFTAHHKDSLELKHEQDDDAYDPTLLEESKPGLMDLLSKLS